MKWEQEKIFHDGNSYFKQLELDISQAKYSIFFETYIFEQDALGKLVLKWLEKASRRGVDVWLLLDGIGSSNWNYSKIQKAREMGFKIKIYHPLPWQITSHVFDFKSFSIIFKFLQRVNRRNHRKMCIIDQMIAFAGGINVCAKEVEWFSGKQAWRDTGIRVEGASVQELVSAFDIAWEQRFRIDTRLNLRKRKREVWSPIVRLNHRRSRRAYYTRDFKRRIRRAKTRVWLTTPYFVPGLGLLNALRQAAKRGVDVRILLPGKSDIAMMYWLHLTYYNILLRTKVRIYEYMPSILHAKIYLIDDFATVGSSNLNYRSFVHDLEVDIVVTHESSIRTLENQFGRDLEMSRQLTLDQVTVKYLFQHMLMWFAAKIKRWF